MAGRARGFAAPVGLGATPLAVASVGSIPTVVVVLFTIVAWSTAVILLFLLLRRAVVPGSTVDATCGPLRVHVEPPHAGPAGGAS